MHGNQWVLKIAVLKYYSVSKRGPKQATDPISLHTKFGDNSSNTFPLNERKPCVTPDIGRQTPDIGQRTSDGGKSKNNISTPQGGGHNSLTLILLKIFDIYSCHYFATNKKIAITHLWHAMGPQTMYHLIAKDKVAEQHI